MEEKIERLKNANTLVELRQIVNEQDDETRQDKAFSAAVFAAVERIVGK